MAGESMGWLNTGTMGIKGPGESLNLWDLEESSLGFGAHVFKELIRGDQRSLGLCWNLDNWCGGGGGGEQ